MFLGLILEQKVKIRNWESFNENYIFLISPHTPSVPAQVGNVAKIGNSWVASHQLYTHIAIPATLPWLVGHPYPSLILQQFDKI